MDGTELTGARPSTAPVLKGASQGTEDGETGLGNPFRASPEGERWRGGQAMRRAPVLERRRGELVRGL
jgi:hypothetical protein